MKTGLASIASMAIRTRVRRRGKKLGLAMRSRWGFSALDRKVETHPSRANRAYLVRQSHFFTALFFIWAWSRAKAL
jgi:hypothetical protein